jgi:hypothetical protein
VATASLIPPALATPAKENPTIITKKITIKNRGCKYFAFKNGSLNIFLKLNIKKILN